MHTTQRQNDELYCTRCHKRWDVSEEPPRSCAPSDRFVRRGRNPDLTPPVRLVRYHEQTIAAEKVVVELEQDILEEIHRRGLQHLIDVSR